MKLYELTPIFCEFIPEIIEPGLIYISEEYTCSIHLCACGCGIKTVLPIGDPNSGVKWLLTKDNGMVSFSPSIGNWQLPCRSHYFIKDNKVVWC